MTTTETSRLTLCLIGVALLALAGLTACGGDNLSCGDNTVEQNGRCVLQEGQAVACGDGTRVSTSGACVIDDTSCGPGTAYSDEQGTCLTDSGACADGASFDPDSGTCVAASSCGQNTTEQDGTCVVDTDALCGSQTGVTFNQDSGRCEVSSGKCGDGTTQSAESGNCVIAEDSCGDGLAVNDQGECVPTDSICNENATFKRLGGQPACVPDVGCQEGDVVLDTDGDPATPGLCVSPAEQLAANADVTDNEIDDDSANNDPDSGTPQQVTAPSVGQTSTYAGVIQSGDSQDIDAFTFMGSEGQWFNLAVQSTGIPQPWFEIDGPNGYHREAAYGLQGDPARTLALPYDGEYTVAIKPTAALNDRFSGPYGGEDWSYVASLEQIDAPARGDLNSVDLSTMEPTISGNLGASLQNNVYALNNLSGTPLVEVSVDSLGDDADAILQTWSSPTDFAVGDLALSEGESYTLPTPTSGGSAPLIAADWTRALGPNLNYEIGISPLENSEDLGSISAGGSATSSQQTVMADNSFFYVVDLTGGDVIELSASNDENAAIDYTVTDETGNTVAEESGAPVPGSRAPADDYDSGYFYASEGGIHVIEVSANQSGTSLTNLELTVNSQTPNDLGSIGLDDSISSGTISSTIDAGRSGFHRLEVSPAAFLSGEVQITGGATANVEVFRGNADPSLSAPAVSVNGSGTISFSDAPAVGTDILIGIGAEAQINSYSVSLTTGTDVPEVEPNDTRQTATPIPLDTNVQGEVEGNEPTLDYYSIDLSSALGAQEVLSFNLTQDGFSEINDWRCQILDGSGNTVAEYSRNHPGGPSENGGDEGCRIFLDSAPAGTYYLEIYYKDDDVNDYDLIVERLSGVYQSEPNDTRANANTLAFSDFSNGVDIYGHGKIFDPDTDFWELTVPSGGSVSSFEVVCDALGPDVNDELDFTLYDQADNELDSATQVSSATLGSGSVSASDAPFAIEYNAVEGSDDSNLDTLYRCSYQSP